MKKIVLSFFCAILSFIGLEAQNLSLPYIQDFSTVVGGDMQTLSGSTVALTAMPSGIVSVSNAFGAGGALRVGDNGSVGSLTLQPISGVANAKVKLSFRAVPVQESTSLNSKVEVV